MMSNPSLFQEFPHIAALLSEGCDDRQESTPADPSVAGLNAMTDLALNHGLPQSSLGGIVGGLDPLDLQEGPEAIGNLEQLLAGAHRLGPRRSLTLLVARDS